jgi:hypothetical protein
MEFVACARPEYLMVIWTNRSFNNLSNSNQDRFVRMLKDIFLESGASWAFMTDEALSYIEDHVTIEGDTIHVDPCYPDGSLMLIKRIWTRNLDRLQFLRGGHFFHTDIWPDGQTGELTPKKPERNKSE